jgi:hypothetical protein
MQEMSILQPPLLTLSNPWYHLLPHNHLPINTAIYLQSNIERAALAARSRQQSNQTALHISVKSGLQRYGETAPKPLLNPDLCLGLGRRRESGGHTTPSLEKKKNQIWGKKRKERGARKLVLPTLLWT